MKNIYEDLTWLPRPPEDFIKRVSEASNGSQLRELAKYALDDNQLKQLAKKVHCLQLDQTNLEPLISLSLGIISNATTQMVAPTLVGSALRFGIALTVIQSEYNQIAQIAFSPDSTFPGDSVDFILVSIDYRGLPIAPTPGDLISAERNVQECISYIKSIIEALQAKTGAKIIIQNIVSSGESIFGNYEARLPGTGTWIITQINFRINEFDAKDIFVLDLVGLASNLGIADWHDPTLWNLAKLPFAPKFNPIYSDIVCRILAAKLGRSRRCLIMDLDNTLWGGVIGDDGVNGILIGNGDPTAEAHLNIQRTARELRDRGVVLAISSKNEDATARQPFKEHPDMLLREEHIAVFQANWTDKATNIRAIAEELSLGLESMVFLDDNPAERLQVRRELPDVAVPELPEDPALYARTLIAAGYFEAITLSEEDRKRASFYEDNAKRTQILRQSSDIGAYLKSLNMEITFSPFNSLGRTRITQLISKSNQFNLTTKRYDEAEVHALEINDDYFTRQIRLKDVFGDNGMISVIICRKYLSEWEIDTWLMSCRVLGRQVELAALQDIVFNAKRNGINRIVGTYSPSPRNAIVKDHYNKLGFTKITNNTKIERWVLDIQNYEYLDLPMLFNNNP